MNAIAVGIERQRREIAWASSAGSPGATSHPVRSSSDTRGGAIMFSGNGPTDDAITGFAIAWASATTRP